MFKTLWKARKVFQMPKFHIKFGKWINDPCLPVWRCGNIIHLARYKNRIYFYSKTICKHIKIKNGYLLLKHKVNKDCYWKQPIRSKLKRLHLSWIPPEIQLPIWLTFHIFNHDVTWKYKWDEIRYEYPPQFTIVFFGLSLSMWCNWEQSEYQYPDMYWESLLNYVYGTKNKENFNVIEFRNKLGKWESWKKDNTKITYWQLQYDFLKPKYKNILYQYDNKN